MTGIYRKLRKRARHECRRLVFHGEQRLGHFRDAIWLVGDGRSGTTWVSSLINHDGTRREMFEPFHPYLIPQVAPFQPHQYLRGGADYPAIYAVAQRIFSGRFCHPRTDQRQRIGRHQGLLVKDIFVLMSTGQGTEGKCRINTF